MSSAHTSGGDDIRISDSHLEGCVGTLGGGVELSRVTGGVGTPAGPESPVDKHKGAQLVRICGGP